MREIFPIHKIPVPKQQQAAEEPTILPEIALQQEMREHYTYAPSSQKWYLSVIKGESFGDKDAAELLLAQKTRVAGTHQRRTRAHVQSALCTLSLPRREQ